MSFSVSVMRNMSEPNKLDKDLELLLTLEGTLREETSILSPVIMVSGDVNSVAFANYFYVAALGRYYFITDIRTIRSGMFEISGKVDVLTTYKTSIRTNTGIIKKQEKEFNCYINDGSLKAYQNPFVVTNYFPSGFSGHGFILAVAGG